MPEPQDEQRDDYAEGRGGRSLPLPPQETGKKRPMNPLRLSLQVGAVFGVIGLCGVGLIGMQNRSHDFARQRGSANNLKMIALAIHNYHDTYGDLPSNTYSVDGKPLLSWRVHLLPFLEDDILKKQFKLDEPWDSPNNISLLNKMPHVYSGSQSYGQSLTHYRGFSSPGAVFERRLVQGREREEKDRLRILDLADGPENTILIVEAGDPVEWTKPYDLDASPGKPFPRVGGLGWRKVFQALMEDGSVRRLRLETPEPILRALVTHSSGEPLPPGWDEP
jgi:uncharacterized protein DUF1559